MVSERAKEANQYGKYDTPYKRKDVPQNATGNNAVKAKDNKPESKGAKRPEQFARTPSKNPPVPTPRPDQTPQPIFEPGGSMMPPIYEPGGGQMPPPFAPGGSQLAMPAGTPFPPGPSTAPVLPQLQNLPSTGMTQTYAPSMPPDPRLNMQAPDPRIAALLSRGGASGPSPLGNGAPVIGATPNPIIGATNSPLGYPHEPVAGNGKPVIPWFGS